MDTRKGRKRSRLASDEPAPAVIRPVGEADNAAILAKLEAILAEQHELRRLVHRLAVPVEVVTTADAAERIGVSVPTLERITARGVFSDGRAPERRVAGSPRLYFADELDVYRTDGKVGVARLRRELGRN